MTEEEDEEEEDEPQKRKTVQVEWKFLISFLSDRRREAELNPEAKLTGKNQF